MGDGPSRVAQVAPRGCISHESCLPSLCRIPHASPPSAVDIMGDIHTSILPPPSAVDIMGDIRTSILDEVDFRKEAQHLQAFSNFLDSSNLRGVATCPYVYKQFSSKRCGREAGGPGGWRRVTEGEGLWDT